MTMTSMMTVPVVPNGGGQRAGAIGEGTEQRTRGSSSGSGSTTGSTAGMRG